MNNNVNITCVGDILLGRSIENYIETNNNNDYSNIFRYVKKYIEESDISMGNLECLISDKKDNRLFFRGGPSFIAKPKSIESLTNSGLNTINITNNHSNDYGNEALQDTIDILENNKFNILGKKNEPYKKFSIDNIDIIILGVSRNWGRIKNSEKVYTYNNETLDLIKSLKKECDILIVSIHWGTEYVFNNNSYQKEWATKMIESGCDIIIGHHPHVIQNMEKLKIKDRTGYVFYSLGNFILDDPHDHKGVRDSMILKIIINKTTKKVDFKYLPCVIYPNLGFIPKPLNKSFNNKYPRFYTKIGQDLDSEVIKYFNDTNEPKGYRSRVFNNVNIIGGYIKKLKNYTLLYVFLLLFILIVAKKFIKH